MSQQQTKFDVSVTTRSGKWIVVVRSKVDSEHRSYEDAEARWASIVQTLPEFRG